MTYIQEYSSIQDIKQNKKTPISKKKIKEVVQVVEKEKDSKRNFAHDEMTFAEEYSFNNTKPEKIHLRPKKAHPQKQLKSI